MGNGMNDELIRKQDVLELPRNKERNFRGEVVEETIDVELIKALPPVQTERIKGHWVEITSINHTYKCSVCGRLLVNITDGKNNVAKNYPYCHCGADMRCSENPNS